MKAKKVFKKILSKSFYEKIKDYYGDFSRHMAVKSIRQAVQEQGFSWLVDRLTQIVPDLTDQYSDFKVEGEYLATKVRAQHAFQVSMVKEAVRFIEKQISKRITIVDVGDSAGTHLQYIAGLFEDKDIQSLSVNLDADAVKRIKEKGLEAVCVNAEDLAEKYDIDVDIFLCFETLEHLFDPVRFLHKLSTKTRCKLFVATVPYLRSSRVGFHHLRNSCKMPICAETTHILELSPECWRLLFQFSGWRVVSERIYLQYPRRHWLRFSKGHWKKSDFEGFYGVILARDNTWSDLYKDW